MPKSSGQTWGRWLRQVRLCAARTAVLTAWITCARCQGAIRLLKLQGIGRTRWQGLMQRLSPQLLAYTTRLCTTPQELADLGDDAPRMEHLWEWSCALTAGKNVSCMAWNKANPDLLAVGYGSNSFASASNASASATSGTGNLAATGNGNAGAAGAAAAAAGAAGAATASGGAASAAAAAGAATATSTARGLVAFWSIKNLQHPLWWFEAKAAVTALDFSTYSPNMLAVGLYDGTVAIYDIKSKQGTPSVESDVHSGKHSDPVWKVCTARAGEHPAPSTRTHVHPSPSTHNARCPAHSTCT